MYVRRRAVSLMEVMVSLSIMAGSAILLSQLAGVGREHSRKSAELTVAQQLAQNKLTELLAGISPLEPTENEPFLSSPEWTHSIAVMPLETMPNLNQVTVSVKRQQPTNASRSEIAGAESMRPIYRMVRWINSPEYAADDELDLAGNSSRFQRSQ